MKRKVEGRGSTRVESRGSRVESRKDAARRHASGPRPSTLDSRPHSTAPRLSLASRLRKIRLFLCDVDGILTNATVFMGASGEFKQFHIRDGLGLRLLQREGIKVGWISNRSSPATAARAADLRIDFLFQKDGSKVAAAAAMLEQTGLEWDEIIYMGDDIVDLGVMKRAGVAMTVPDALDEAKALADYVTKAPGGHGAVREVVGMLLRAQGKWAKLVKDFSA